MPLFYHHINEFAKIAIWRVAEEKNFFTDKVPLHREITHPHKQLQHLGGRYLLQHLYPDFPYDLIEIADTRKPFLPNEEYHFSISHCGDYAAAIVSKTHRVGIDVELVTPKVDRIKHKFLSDIEMSHVRCQTSDIKHLTLLWCCKEAVFKWYGNGGVDFKKHIHLKEINADEEVVNAEFLKHDSTTLQLHYKFFADVCMVWVVS